MKFEKMAIIFYMDPSIQQQQQHKQQPQGKVPTNNNSGSVDISDCSSSSNACEAASTDS